MISILTQQTVAKLSQGESQWSKELHYSIVLYPRVGIALPVIQHFAIPKEKYKWYTM